MLIINVLENYTITITCYSARVEGEHEDVAGEIKRRMPGEVHIPYSAYSFERYAPLHRLVHASVHVPERIMRHLKSLFSRAVYDGAEIAHIKRGGVAAQPPPCQELLVANDKSGCKLMPSHFVAAGVAQQAVERDT